MSRLDELPPDQQAALSVLLRGRRSYAEVGSMLGIGEQSVHDRAQAALALLAPAQARGLKPHERTQIGDYLLGQQANVGERLRTRTLLSASPAAAGWARAVAAELAPLADGGLPEIPEPEPGAEPAGAPPPGAPRTYSLSEAASAPSSTDGAVKRSRLGGALILTGLAIVIVVVVLVVVLASGGGSSSHTKTGKTTATSSTGPKVEGRYELHSANPGQGGKAVVEVIAEGEKRAFYIQAEHLPESKNFFYAIWLYNSPSSALALSKAPDVGSTHKLEGAALLPSGQGVFKEILLTRETSTRPSHPGHVVLRGDFGLKG